jgi:hypothetical protein
VTAACDSQHGASAARWYARPPEDIDLDLATEFLAKRLREI